MTATVDRSTVDPGWDQGRTGTGDEPAGRRPLRQRILHGRPDDPAWVRPALLVLLIGTGVLYFWNLSASGWANSFYSAAAQAGSESWKAFFFGSSDAANSITVDKPPASLWAMALSIRVFGLSSWSILAPQALMGVATVGVLYSSVRRRFSPAAGLLAGAALALTPVAALMFKFNNPDALLMLLLTGAAYAVLRACEHARVRWMILAGVLVGFGFLTKQLQAFLVLPSFGLTYLVAAPTTFGRRIRDLLAAFAAMIAAAGWWIAIVSLWPASSRPFIGGSQNNSILELTFGYNGFGRLTGNETGSVGGGGGGGTGTGMWGSTGLTRLFGSEFAGQIMWLVPAAAILLVAGLVLTARRPRTSATRAAFILWGSWLVVTFLTFSLMKGIFHAYYTVALAPAVAALVGIGAVWLWERHDIVGRFILAGVTVVTTLWAYELLSRSDTFLPWLRPVILVAGLLAAAGLAAGALFGPRISARVLAVAAAAALFAGLAGPAAYAVQTATTGHTGSIVSAGPTVSGGQGGFGGGPGGMRGMGGGMRIGQGAPPAGGFGTQGGTGTRGGFGGGGGMGGLLNGTTPSAELKAALLANADSYTWVAAAVGSNNASGYQLSTQKPVMAIGGFNGSDPSPTLAQFKAYVAAGKIHYFIGGGGFGGGNSSSGSNVSSQISSWVEANYTSTTIGGTTVYDLTSAATTSTTTTTTTTTT